MTSNSNATHFKTALFLLAAMIVTVGSALGFQYIGGYLPCKLCLEQRYPYYAGIPLMALAVASSGLKWPAGLTRLLLALGGLLMLIGLGLAVFHAGVEWKFWAGPDRLHRRRDVNHHRCGQPSQRPERRPSARMRYGGVARSRPLLRWMERHRQPHFAGHRVPGRREGVEAPF